MRRKFTSLPAALVLAGTVLAAGCVEDADDLVRPSTEEERLFARYVALGNSITAGFQSGGITPQSQADAYPVLLAARAGATFVFPELNAPGCPPPLAQPFPLGTGTTAPGVPCAFRATPTGPVQNLAVPGANVATLLNHLADPNPGATFNRLQTFFLGGRSQIAAMQSLDPTLVSAWIGNNDALGVIFNGVPAASLTPVADFQQRVTALASAIAAEGPQDAVLIGVVNPLLVPVLQPGAYYWAAAYGKPLTDPTFGRFGPKRVDFESCNPSRVTGPNPLARNLVTFFALADTTVMRDVIVCDPAKLPTGSPLLLTLEEQQEIATRVGQFNAAIKGAAEANGWIYVDPNALLQAQLADPNKIRKCQGLATAATAEQFRDAVVNTCPGPTAPNFFGSLISFDGFHPSSEAHELIADAIASALNAKHGLSL